jgi:hypothetical protein
VYKECWVILNDDYDKKELSKIKLPKIKWNFDSTKLQSAINQIPEVIQENHTELDVESSFKKYMNKNESLNHIEQQWRNIVKKIEDYWKENHEMLIELFIISKINNHEDVSLALLELFCFEWSNYQCYRISKKLKILFVY